ncbi:MAG: DUF1501 domain-containing protein [Planctomycetes bacterium]|nr:DUF1501 domain-containing protein [Planctomycetota bacterium]
MSRKAQRNSQPSPPRDAASTHAEWLLSQTRRQFFANCGFGIGSMALAGLLNPKIFAQDSRPARADDPMAPKPPHFNAKAKSVIYLFMNGAPSQPDLLDPKPKASELNGKPCPDEYTKGERFAFIKGTPKVLGSPYKFKQYGQAGAYVSDLLPNLTKIIDDVAIVRTMKTDAFNHAPAELFINTGLARIGRPSMGSWVTYGIGTENANLPGFVVLLSGGGQPSGGCSCWSAGFLPTVYQGVQMRSQGDPVLFVNNPEGLDDAGRRRTLDALRDLNQMTRAATGDTEVNTRISQYELAYRMQSSVPELMDISKEAPETLKMYGVEEGKASFARNCILARRLIERGTRFVQLYHRGWDNHGTSPGDDLMTALPRQCKDTDQACAALVQDLKQRGLLDSTLVVWGGEFGRTPMNEERNGSTFLGRDHHPHAFTMWFAGGGVKRGIVLGETDELGYFAIKDQVHVHDLQATVLHLLGMDHKRLTYRFQGRDFRLTDVHGEIVTKLMA